MQDQREGDEERLLIEIQHQFARGEWVYTKHAVDRVIERGIWSYEVKEAIGTGEIIEDYPKDKYRPSCLILGWTKKKRPLHLQVSYPHPGEKIKVITLYEPNLKKWKEGFRERRG
jgi:hypothetical protein